MTYNSIKNKKRGFSHLCSVHFEYSTFHRFQQKLTSAYFSFCIIWIPFHAIFLYSFYVSLVALCCPVIGMRFLSSFLIFSSLTHGATLDLFGPLLLIDDRYCFFGVYFRLEQKLSKRITLLIHEYSDPCLIASLENHYFVFRLYFNATLPSNFTTIFFWEINLIPLFF